MENKSYKIEYTLDKKDYYLFKKWGNSKFLKIIYLILLVGLIFMRYKDLINGSIVKIISLTISYILMCWLYFIITKIITKIRLYILFKQKKDLHFKINIKLSDELIEVNNYNSSFKFTWYDIKKIILKKNYIYLMLSSIKAIIIPLEKIDEKDLVDFIKSKITTHNIVYK